MTASFDYYMDGQLAKAVYGDHEEEFLWDGLALIHRGATSFVNGLYVTGGNPILSSKDGVMFNNMLGNTLGTKSADKFNPVSMTAFGKTADQSAFFTEKPYIGELGYAFCFGAVAHSITSDGIMYTWDWATSKISGISWIEDYKGAKMGFSADVTWTITVYWKCVRGNGCTPTGSFTHSTVKNVTGIQWISYSAAQGAEIPTFNSVLEGIGVCAAEYISGVIPWPVDIVSEDYKKILSRPADNTKLTNMKLVNHNCKE